MVLEGNWMLNGIKSAEQEFEQFGLFLSSVGCEAAGKQSDERLLEQVLCRRSDVLAVRLINRRTTLLQTIHWPALLSIVSSNDEWQTSNLTRQEKTIMAKTRSRGKLSFSEIPPTGTARPRQFYIRQLEERLLIHSHRLSAGDCAIESWQSWSLRLGVCANMTVDQARLYFEQIIEAFGIASGHQLPWTGFNSSHPEHQPGWLREQERNVVSIPVQKHSADQLIYRC